MEPDSMKSLVVSKAKQGSVELKNILFWSF